jgi:autotransporter-associated beta strand protein
VFQFSTWLRRSFPSTFLSRKQIIRRNSPRPPRLERLEDRITPNITVTTSYAGLNAGNSGDAPPDTNGAAGTVSYIQTANQVMRLFPNKNSSAGTITSQLSTFFYNQGGLPSNWSSGGQTQGSPGLSDPIIVWDEQINRFIVGDQQIDFNGGPVSAFYIAVSTSATPATLTNSDWKFYSIDITETANGGYFADYPGNFGWNHDAFVFCLNMFRNSSNGNSHVVIGSVNIQDLVNGVSQANLHYYKNDLNDFDDRPTVMHDSVAGDPMWLVTEHGDGSHIDLIKMTNVLTNSAGFAYSTIAVNSYSGAVPPLQKDGSSITTNIDSRIMKAAQYNGMLVASHTVSNGAGDRDIARWYEFNVTGTPTLVQQGNVTDTTSGAGQAGVYDAYPVVDINAAGAIGMTYSQSASNASYAATGWLSAFITARTAGDAAGTMETPILVQAGGAKNNDTREGDLSGINTDSTNGSFWACTEWTNSSSQWVEETSSFTLAATDVNLNAAGNLVITDVVQNGKNDTLTVNVVTRSGVKYVEVHDPNNTVGASGSAIQIDGHTVDAKQSLITGNIQANLSGGNDSLTLDNSGGDPVPSGGFADNEGTGTDTLTLTNGTFTNATYTYSGSGGGTINLDSDTITVTNLASIADSNTYTNETFILPAAAKATLQDDGTNNNGISEITSSNGAAITTTFRNPGTSLTVTTSGGSSLVSLTTMDNGFAPASETFSGQSGDLFQLTAAGAVPSATSVTLTTATLDLNGLSPTINGLTGSGTITDSSATASTLTVGASDGSGVFSGVIQNGAGGVALIKNGGGTETLSGPNTYSGATTISAGTLQVGAANAIPSTTDVTDNGTLDLAGNADTIGALAGSGAVLDSNATGATLTVGATGNNGTFSGTIIDQNGSLSFTKTGASTETLTATNTYSGITTISGGTMSINSDGNLGMAPASAVANQITIANGATLQLTNGSAVTINSNRGLTLGSGGGTIMTSGTTVNYGGAIAGGSGLTKSDTGDLVLDNNASLNVPGSVTISAGRLFFTSQNALGTGAVSVTSTLDYSGGSALTLANTVTLASGADVAARGAALTLPASTVLPTSGTVIFNNDDQATTTLVVQAGVVLTGTLTVQVGGGNSTVSSATLSGAITGAGGLTKTQTGTLVLSSSANAYTGNTSISAGTLKLGASGVIPSGSSAGNVSIASGATLDMGGFSTTINGLTGSGTVDNSASGGPFTLTVGGNNTTSTFGGTIQNTAGTLALAKTGTGTLTLSSANTYSGGTIISTGTLQLGIANAIPSTSDVTDTGTLDLAGLNDTIGALAGAGKVTSSAAGTVTLTVGTTGNNGNFSGIIQNGSATVRLTKSGTGTETISGLANSYTGATTVSAGTLEIDGAIVSNVTVSGIGTLDGSGTTGTVTATAGTLAPGKPLGTLHTGSLNLQAGSAYSAAIGGNTTGKYGQDSIASGTVTLDTTGAGVKLNLIKASYSPQVGDTYIILSNSGGSAITGTFVAGAGIDAVAPGTPLPEGQLLSSNFLGTGLPATITYKAGSGNNSVGIVVHPDLTVTISNPSASITAGGPVQYTVSYSDFGGDFKSSTLTTSNVHLVKTGTATGTLSFDSGSGSTRTVTISNITGDGTLAISIDAGSAVDTAGNLAPAAGPSATFIVDNTPPTVTISAPSKPITGVRPVTYSVTYADAHFGSSSLTAADITLNKTGTANGTVSVSSSGSATASYTVTINSITGDGSLGISIAAGTAVDQAGNLAPAAGPSSTFIVDNTPPTVSISNPSAAYAAGGPITYTVTYADANFGSSDLSTSDVHLLATGTATGTLSFDNSTGAIRTVTISSITGDGSLGISIDAGSAFDLAGNEAPAAGPSNTFIVDNTPPTVSIAGPSKPITAGGPITYTVTYADANFGSSSLTTTDVTLNTTGTATGTIGVSGSGTSYTVSISGITGDGSLGISLAANTAVDLAGNEAPASGPSGTFIVDNTPPSVSISAPSQSITASSSVSYTVTYADANFGSSSLVAGDISLNTTGTASGTIGVSGSGTSYTVTVSGITGDGSLGISLAANTAVDLAGNEAPAAGPSSTFIVDNTPPSITISAPSQSITASSSVTYTVTYADANFGSSSLTTSDITLNTTGTATGTLGLSGSGTLYTVTISGISGDGTLGFSIAANTAVDQAGNKAAASGPSSTFIVDNTPPTVSISSPSAAYAAGGPITYTVTYADANFGSSSLVAGDITLNTTGTAGGTIGVSGSGTSYTVTVSGITGDGSLGISLAANTAVDLAGNEAPASGPSGTFIVDNTPPSVSIGGPSKSITTGGPITYSVTYADAHFGSSSLTTSDITVNTTGTATGTLGLSGSGTSYTVTISGISGDGTLGFSIAANTAVDLAGNEAPAAGPSSTFIVDNTPPNITISAPSKPIIASGSITYTVSYADANFGSSSLSLSDITLNTTGTANGTLGLTGTGTSYTVTISGVSGDGTLGFSIAANTAVDQAGNEASAAGPSSTFIVDNTPPSVTISAPSQSITASNSVSYTVTYADANFGSSSLVASDITLNTSGTANGSIAVTGSGTSYTVTVSGITGDGSLGISIAANTAVDLAGNEAPAAGPSGTFIVDNTPPSVSIGGPSKSITTGGPVTYTVTYADANFGSSNLTAGDISLTTPGTASGTISVSGSGTSYTVTISNITGDGTPGISIAANTAVDLAGNEAPAAGPSGTFIVDNTPPSITISAPSKPIIASGSISYTVTYADAHFASSSLSLSDVTLNKTGTATGTLGLSGSGTSYTVTISGVSGDGTLGFSIAADTAIDQAGNKAAASGPSSTFIVDNTPPSVSISKPSAAYAAGGPITYTVNYADANFGSSSLTVADISLNTTGTASGSIAVTGSGTSYTVTINNITGDGSLDISLAANTAVDLAGNEAPAAGPSNTFIVDNTPPTVTISASSKSITASSSVSYTVSYADAHFGSSSLVASDITLNTTGTASGTIGVTGSGTSYTVTISGITGDGSLGISVAANTAVDLAGNEAPAAGPSGTFIVDNTPPSVTVSAPSHSITASGSITYTESYADANFGTSSLVASDITLNKTGTADGTISVSGSGTSYTVTISGITGDGSLGISLAAGTAVDQAGNTAGAAGPSSTFIVDNTPPSVSISAPSQNITAGGSVSYTVTYADANFGSSSLTASDVTLDKTGTAGGSIGVSGSGTSYTVTISNITGDGSLGISLGSGTAVDLAGNTAPASGPANTFVVDNTPPSVIISSPSQPYTAISSVSYTVTYSDPHFASSNLTASDITIDATGTATGTIGLSGSGTSYTVSISNISGNGTLGFSIAANTAVDVVGNESLATGPGSTVIVDNTPPTSSVTALPAFSPRSFTVSWSGSDNPGGSGVATYTVYVIDNGGAPQAIATDTAATSIAYSGVNGHTYGFYSVATDKVGNVQPTPTSVQATTKVDDIAPTSTTQVLPANSLPSFTVSWSGQDNVGGSGLASFNVYVSDNGGAYTLWQNHTTQTSAVFSGQINHSYGFYTDAIDVAGNIESKPALPETLTLTPVFQTPLPEAENITAPPSVKLSTVLTPHYTDVDKNHKPAGIAVTLITGNGTWQYYNGSAWANITGVSIGSALLLPGADRVRFLPAPNWNGQADLLYVGWDGSQGRAGGRADTTILAGGTPFSRNAGLVAVTVPLAPHAPTWTAGSTTLAAILPGPAGTGQTVQQAFGSVFADPNSALPAGIAVTGLGATSKQGTWQYQLAVGGGGWQNFPKVSARAALLLGPQDLIRFVPASTFTTGTVTLQAHAWDGSKLTDGGTVALNKKGSTGGTTPVGSSVLTGKLYVNHSPTQNPPGVISLGSIAENTLSKPVSITTLVKTHALGADVDKGATLGMALTGASGPGTWQYQLPGGGWLNVPATVSAGSALLLPGGALLRFVPVTNQSGTATLSWDAWDGTQGRAGQQGFVIPLTGGATAFSSTSASATLSVTASKHAPAWSGSGAALTPVVPGTTPLGDKVGSIFGNYFKAASGTTAGIAVTGTSGTKNGQWQYSTDGGTTWLSLATASNKLARLLSANDLIRFVPKAGFLGTVSLTAHAWDGTGGFADGSTANLAAKHATGGTTPFSTGTLSAVCLVNTAPKVAP